MPDISRQGLMNPSPVIPGATNPLFQPPTPGMGDAAPAPAPPPQEAAAPAKSPEPVTTVTYFVQTGAFGKESEAENQRANLALMGVDAAVLSPEVGDKQLYRVRIGPIISVDEVRTLVATLKNNGISTNIIKVNSVKPKDATSR
ncbi:MAG: SPOR domain-containing protein [Ferrovum sp.]|nr:SPOR domain-containing protein [Ferrovum sp.]